MSGRIGNHLFLNSKERLSCFLWWMGGLFTFGWMSLLLFEALYISEAKLLVWEDTATYLLLLGLCLGAKKAHKNANGGEEQGDRFAGEIWMGMLAAFWIFVMLDYYWGFKFLVLFGVGHVTAIPGQLHFTMFGVAAILGLSKGADYLGFIGDLFTKIQGVQFFKRT